MKKLFVCVLISISFLGHSQVLSGKYESGLSIAYNPEKKIITGFFESYTGYDGHNSSQFSCIFYIEGLYHSNISTIDTYYPTNRDKDKIVGKLKINDSCNVSIVLPQEHGGCWNVAHFADEYVDFELIKASNWIEIRYIDKDKSYFYNADNEEMKRRAYLIKGDIIYIDKIQGEWVHCTYFGKNETAGWIKKTTINN